MNLQPLKWVFGSEYYVAATRSPTHEYSITEANGKFTVEKIRLETMRKEDVTGFSSLADAQNFAQSDFEVKMQPYVKPDSITDIANWFKKAKPEPTNKDICTQIGVHFEEVAEMQLALGDTSMCHRIDQNAQDYKDGHQQVIIEMLVGSKRREIELLDALCDQIVTATGVAYIMGFDVEGALKEVIRSNNSKMVKGKFEFDVNGKIMKPESYSKPDLTPFISTMQNLHNESEVTK